MLSSEILAGMITRGEALKILDTPAYDEEQMELDLEYIAKKLGVSKEEFRQVIEGENKTWKDYRNVMKYILMGAKISRLLGIESRNLR